MKNKKAQFYLMAAIILMVIIFSIFTTTSYLRSKEEKVVYDLNKELGFESGKVVDYSIYNKEDTSAVLEDWIKKYVEGASEKEIENWVFVYGDKNNIKILMFNKRTIGTITLDAGGPTSISVPGYEVREKNIITTSDEITIKVGDFDYTFELGRNQNFGMLVSKGGYVATSEEEKKKEEGKNV